MFSGSIIVAVRRAVSELPTGFEVPILAGLSQLGSFLCNRPGPRLHAFKLVDPSEFNRPRVWLLLGFYGGHGHTSVLPVCDGPPRRDDRLMELRSERNLRSIFTDPLIAAEIL